MTNLQRVLNLIEKEIKDGLDFIGESAETYGEFIELVYAGDSSQFKEDIDYTLTRQHELEFVTDALEVIEEDGEVISYRKLINIVKREFFN